MMDWGEGTYENTASTLVGAAQACVDALGLGGGERVLDLGCGTGNVALLAAKRGAKVVAIDPSARLVEVTRAQAAREGLAIEARVGDAMAIDAPDGSFDALASNFAVIFAPDAETAAGEMLRVVRPGGRIALTTWLTYGPIAEAGKILRGAMAALAPPPGAASDAGSAASATKPPPWGDEAAVRALFASRGAEVAIDKRTIHFEAASPEAWFAAQEESHPVWRHVRRQASPEVWSDVRARSIAALAAGNLAPAAFRAASDYLVVRATRR